MPRPQSLRLSLLSLAREALAATDPPSEPITVTISTADGKTTLTLTSRPGELDGIDRTAALPEMQANVLQAVTEAGGFLTARAIAERAGYSYSSHLRSCLRDMVTAGLLRAESGGYRA